MTAKSDTKHSPISDKLDEAAYKAELKIREAAHGAQEVVNDLKQESKGWLHSWQEWRRSFGLKNPGTFETLTRDVRGVFAQQLLFDGAKFDFSKVLSPSFQVMHSFVLGSQVQPSTYSFGSFYADQKLFLRGNLDSEGNLQAQVNYSPTNRLSLKFMPAVGPAIPSSASFEVDYSGLDFSTNLKMANPDPTDIKGIYVLSHLQSVSPGLAVGFEAALQKPDAQHSETQVTYVAKYHGDDFTATTSFSQLGVVQATYHQKVSEQVELGAEVQMISISPEQRDSNCTLGAKWDFRAACIKAQIDTTGRVATIMEQRLGPGFSFVLCADLNHMKGTSKFGMGLQLEN